MLRKLLNPFRQGRKSAKTGRAPRRPLLNVEALEERSLLAASVALIGTGIVVQGTSSVDRVIIRTDTRGTSSALDDRITVQATTGAITVSRTYPLYRTWT